MPNNINLNVNPYYDDFSDDKQYQRILFKPGYAVQARELTQIQTILQKQVERFGNHVFKEGAVITGCDYALNTKVPYVKILDTDADSATIDNADLASYEGEVLVDDTTGLKAIIKKTTGGSESGIYKTLHVQYINQGTAGTTTAFPADAELHLESDDTITFVVASSGTTPTGYGSLFSLKDGIIYGKGTFVIHQEQTVVVSAYSSSPSKKVGVTIVESIVGADADNTLLDPATGTYNYTAPGADRLKVSTLLESFEPNAVTADDFNVLFELMSGKVARRYDLTDYGELNKVLARRTYDESGDYTIAPFNLLVREHLKSGDNGGVYSSGDGGSVAKLAVGVSAGKAYVKGYEYQSYATQYFSIDKETDTRDVESANISTAYGYYVIVDEVCGVASLNTGKLVNLYSGSAIGAASASNSDTSAPSSGDLIGTARVQSIEYHSGTVGLAACKYRLYLSDIKMTGGKFEDTVVIYSSTAPAFFADIADTASLQDTSYGTMLFPIAKNLSTLDLGAGYSNDFVYRKVLTGTVTTGGSVTFSLSGDETFAFTANTTTARDNEIMMMANASMTYTTGGPGTAYEKGQIIPLGSTVGTSTGVITSLTSTSLTIDVTDKTLDTTYGVTAFVSVRRTDTSPRAKTLRKNRYVKLQISKDFTTTSTITSSSSTTFTIASIASDDMAVGDIVYHDSNSDGVYTTIGTITGIDTGTGTVTITTAASSLASGGTVRITHPSFNPTTKTLDAPLSLGQYDVIKINSILSGSTSTAFASLATDVTDKFDLNTGQTNSLYDIASITKRGNETYDLSSATNNKRLLIDFDYFEHSSSSSLGGYFSIDSYPLPVQGVAATSSQIEWTALPKYMAPNGLEIDLRDVLDFRATVTAVTGITTTKSTTKLNPVAYTESNKTFLSGIYAPHAQEEFTTDYQYNLGRVDRVILNVEGEFEIMTGVADPTPAARPQPASAMTLGTIYIPPFPSTSPKVARTLNRKNYAAVVTQVENRRYTMRDINDIDQRLESLRKYTELSFLEQKLLNSTLVDSSNNERPKNGILVDDFMDHSRGNTEDPNYSCAIFSGILQPTLKPMNSRFDVATLTNLTQTSKDVFIVVEQTGGATAYEVGQTVTDSTSAASGTIKHVVTLATDTTTNYTWVRLYLEDVSGVFGAGNTITSTTSGGDPVTGDIPADITDETNMLAASLPLILRPDAIVAASAGNIVTLPYTHAVYAENPYASEAINTTNKLLFTYEGTIELTPASDPWFDEENAPEGDSFTLPNTGSTTWFASVAAPPRAAAPASSGTSSTGTPVSDSGTSYTSSGFGGTGSAGQQYYYNPSTGAYEPDYSNQQFINVQ